MNHNINITKGYPALLNMDNTSGLYSYFAIDPCNGNDKIVVSVENLEINADKDLWGYQAIAQNPEGIIAEYVDSYDSDDSVASFLLRKAKIVAEGDVTYCMCLDGGKGNIYHSLPVSFFIGSKYIWLSGKSLDFTDSNIGIYIFFSGGLSLQFEERDVLLQMLNFESSLNIEDVKIINKSQEIFNRQRGRDINHEVFNNIKSPFFDFDFLISYFEHTKHVHTALRDFSG